MRNSASSPVPPVSPKLAGLHCSAEWHLRKNAKACALYSLALRITDGGKTSLHLSIRQICKYFGWGQTSVVAAFRECEDRGFFVRTSTGHGGKLGQPDFANTYEVRLHSTIARSSTSACLVGAETCSQIGSGGCSQNESSLQPPAPRMRAGVLSKQERGCSQNESGTCSQNQQLVSDVESPRESPRELTITTTASATNVGVDDGFSSKSQKPSGMADGGFDRESFLVKQRKTWDKHCCTVWHVTPSHLDESVAAAQRFGADLYLDALEYWADFEEDMDTLLYTDPETKKVKRVEWPLLTFLRQGLAYCVQQVREQSTEKRSEENEDWLTEEEPALACA